LRSATTSVRSPSTADLLDGADILEYEQVHVLDIDNGARFETYTIAGERGSGTMQINGAAARLVPPGRHIIVVSYANYEQAELERYEPRVVHVEANTNRIHHHRRRGGHPALLAGVNRRQRGINVSSHPTSKPRRTPDDCR